MDIKSGVRTTEFWLSIAAFAVGVLLASGVLPVEHWAIKLAGAVAAGLAALGYSLSRGSTKGGAGPTAALIPFALGLALLSSGCAWQSGVKTGLDSAGAALGGYRTAVELHYNDQCSERAKACAPRGTAECPGYLECDGARHKHYLAIKGGHATRAAGYTAIMIGIKKDAVAALQRVGELVQKLGAQLAKEGVR